MEIVRTHTNISIMHILASSINSAVYGVWYRNDLG